MRQQYIKILLRLSIGTAFLSAVADRFGYWPESVSVWGNWENFLGYVAILNPWFPDNAASLLGIVATGAEIVFGVTLLVGLKTEQMAKWSGILLLIFALSMTFSTGVKGPLDYSVFTAAAASFALATMHEKYFEVDNLIDRR